LTSVRDLRAVISGSREPVSIQFSAPAIANAVISRIGAQLRRVYPAAAGGSWSIPDFSA
jgi:hypothetical protein